MAPQRPSNSTRLATLGRRTFDFFERVIRTFADRSLSDHNNELDLSPNNRASFLTEFQRFKIWAVELGLLVPGHGSLDYRLREAESLGETFESYLTDLNQYLEETLVFSDSKRWQAGDIDEALAQIENEPQDAQDSDLSVEFDEGDDDDKEPQWYIDILVESVIEVIDRLFKLSTVIRHPSTRLASSKAKHYQHIDPDSGIDLIGAFGHYDHDFVLSVFLDYQSRVPEQTRQQYADSLQSKQHGSDLWHRQENCTLCAAREVVSSRDDGSSDSDDQQHGQRWVEAEEMAQFLIHRIASANTLRRQQFGYWKMHRDKLEKHTDMALQQRAPTQTTIDNSPFLSLDDRNVDGKRLAFRISDLLAPPTVTTATALRPALIPQTEEKSVTSVSEYAPSDWDPGKEARHFPEPPKRPSNEKFFECPYCYTLCPRQMLSEKAWRAHLIHDLRPYICTYPDCKTGNQLYETRRDWLDHENTAHRKQWRCPEHFDLLYPTLDTFLQHIRKEHERDINVMCSDTYLRASESVSPLADRPCPVCFFAPNDATSLQSHLALHLERFSLFSLPRSTERDDGVDEDEAVSVVAVDAAQDSRDGISELTYAVGGEQEILLEAARIGDSERVNYILRDDPEEGDSRSLKLNDALVEASSAGHVETVQSLLDYGADIEAIGFYGSQAITQITPLMAASIDGHAEVVRVLVERGAKVNSGTDLSMPLSMASGAGRDQVVNILLEQGADVNLRAPDGHTALYDAAAEGHERLVNTLLEHGAKISDQEESALAGAVPWGNEHIVNSLIRAGADVNWANRDNETVLKLASKYDRLEIVLKLLECGADPNKADRKGQTPLWSAATYGQSRIVPVLLEAGADLHCTDQFNETALHRASELGHEDVVKLLIEAGANLEISSRRKGTALEVANKAGHSKIVQMLLAAGASEKSENYHMGDLMQPRVGTSSDSSRAPLPTPRRRWNTELWDVDAEEEAELKLVRLHDVTHTSVVACVAFSADGAFLAIGGCWSAWVVDVGDISKASEFKHAASSEREIYVRSVCFSPDGKLLLTGSEDGFVRLWDVQTGELRRTFDKSRIDVYAVAFSPDGSIVAFSTADGAIELSNAMDGSHIMWFLRHHGVTSVAFSPDGRFLASGALDGGITLIEVEAQTSSTLSREYGHQDSVMSVFFSAGGEEIFTASLDRTVKCWSLVPDSDGEITATRTDTLTGHEDCVLSVAETGDGKWIVSGSRDKTVRIWSSETGDLRVVLRGHQNSVMSVATCPTKNLIATASGDMTFTVWRYDLVPK